MLCGVNFIAAYEAMMVAKKVNDLRWEFVWGEKSGACAGIRGVSEPARQSRARSARETACKPEISLSWSEQTKLSHRKHNQVPQADSIWSLRNRLKCLPVGFLLQAGIDLHRFWNAIRVSSGTSFSWETAVPFIMNENYEKDFSIDLHCKDFALGEVLGLTLAESRKDFWPWLFRASATAFGSLAQWHHIISEHAAGQTERTEQGWGKCLILVRGSFCTRYQSATESAESQRVFCRTQNCGELRSSDGDQRDDTTDLQSRESQVRRGRWVRGVHLQSHQDMRANSRASTGPFRIIRISTIQLLHNSTFFKKGLDLCVCE